ncbi:MAG: sigma-70 family RNA polymerase sigma factor [Segetibacter sp.]
MNVEKYQHITDQELLQSFYLDRDNQWLGILLPRYTLLLLGVCMKYLKNEEEAKDCVQQIFLKTITELHKYQVDYFKSWIYMVAKNHCLMKLRDRPGRSTTDLTENVAGVISEEELDMKFLHLEKDRTLDLMGTALEELSDEQKQCVTLFYLEKNLTRQ